MNDFSNGKDRYLENINKKNNNNKRNNADKKMMIIILLALIIGWMGFIFYMSHQPASVSSGQSGRTISAIINMPIIGEIAKPILTSSIGEFVIRKSAHMFLYFVLSILTFKFISIKSIREHNLTSKIIFRNIAIALVIVFLYACTDEFHQLFVSGRSGEFRDVMVDTCGGIIGLILIGINYFRKI